VPIIRRNNCIYATPGICHSIWMTRIVTVFSPDDVHIVARNMYRKEINILSKIVHQVGFIYKIIQGCTVNKTQNCFQRVESEVENSLSDPSYPFLGLSWEFKWSYLAPRQLPSRFIRNRPVQLKVSAGSTLCQSCSGGTSAAHACASRKPYRTRTSAQVYTANSHLQRNVSLVS
jgi:hypothetical protein